MDRKTFEKLAKSYTAIPVYRFLMADTVTPVSLFLKIRDHGYFPFLLESVEGGENMARYSFLGKNPYQILISRNDRVHLAGPDRSPGSASGIPGNDFHNAKNKSVPDPKTKVSEDAANTWKWLMEKGVELNESYFDALNRLCMKYKEPVIPDMPRLTGGAVGFSAYDTVRLVEELPHMPEDDLQLPDAVWAFYDEIFAFDHVKHRVILIKTVFTDTGDNHKRQYEQAQHSLDGMEEVFYDRLPLTEGYRKTSDSIESNITRLEFQANVAKAKEYIYAGDIFQVVLSQRFRSTFEGDRFMLYRALRMVNPSPYLFYLDFESFALIGSSPEVLVQVQDNKVRLLPIAGTRPRGKTDEEDKSLENDLMGDPKELAEHIMLVDLGRNDLSRVCEPDSVILTRDRVVDRYSHVMHIVSEVTGKLKKGKSAVDGLKNCFPAGTVSGAPKVRAMEIIDELEKSKRGPYAGAVGYFDFSGNMDTCIVIRTMVVSGNDIYIQAGAGIVADSNPDFEYDETVNKAKALIEALDIALKLE